VTPCPSRRRTNCGQRRLEVSAVGDRKKSPPCLASSAFAEPTKKSGEITPYVHVISLKKKKKEIDYMTVGVILAPPAKAGDRREEKSRKPEPRPDVLHSKKKGNSGPASKYP